jgi:hypothetical protein
MDEHGDSLLLAKALEQTSAVGEPLMLLRPQYAIAALPVSDAFTEPCPALDFTRLAKALANASTEGSKPHRASVAADEMPVSGRPSSSYGHIPKPAKALAGRGAWSRGNEPVSTSAQYSHIAAPQDTHSGTTTTKLQRALANICGPLAALRRAVTVSHANQGVDGRSLSVPVGEKTHATCITTTSSFAAVVPLVATHLFAVLGNRQEHSGTCSLVYDALMLLSYVCDPIACLSVEVTATRVVASFAASPVATTQWRAIPGFACLLEAPTSVLGDLLGSVEAADWLKSLRGERHHPVENKLWIAFIGLVRRFVPQETDVEALIRSMAVVILALECRVTTASDAADDNGDNGERGAEPATARDADGLRCLARLLGAEWAGGDDGRCDEHTLLRVVKLAEDRPTPGRRVALYRICFIADEVNQFIQQWIHDSLNRSLAERRIGHPQHGHVILVTRTVQSTASASSPRRTMMTPVGMGLRALSPAAGDSLPSRCILTNVAADMVRSWSADVCGLLDERDRGNIITAFFRHESHSTAEPSHPLGPSIAEASRQSVLTAILTDGVDCPAVARHLRKWIGNMGSNMPRPAPITLERIQVAATVEEDELTVHHGFGPLRYWSEAVPRPRPAAAVAFRDASGRYTTPRKATSGTLKPGTVRRSRELSPPRPPAESAVAETVVFDEERRLAARALEVGPSLRRCFNAAMACDRVWFVHVVPETSSGFLSLKDAADSLAATIAPTVVAIDARPRIAAVMPLSTFCGEYFRFVEQPDMLREMQANVEGGLDDVRFVNLVCQALDLPPGSFLTTSTTIELTAAALRALEQVKLRDEARRRAEADERVAAVERDEERRQAEEVERIYQQRAAARGQQAVASKASRLAIPDAATSPAQLRRLDRKMEDAREVDRQRKAAAERALRTGEYVDPAALPPWMRDPDTAPVRMNRAAVQRMVHTRAVAESKATEQQFRALPAVVPTSGAAAKVELPRHMRLAAEKRSASAASADSNAERRGAYQPQFGLDDWKALVTGALEH